MIRPMEFIARLRELYPDRYENFSGGCLKFHLLLKALYPKAKGWYNFDHVITEIDGVFYDIDGIVANTAGYEPIENAGKRHFIHAWETPRVNEIFV